MKNSVIGYLISGFFILMILPFIYTILKGIYQSYVSSMENIEEFQPSSRREEDFFIVENRHKEYKAIEDDPEDKLFIQFALAVVFLIAGFVSDFKFFIFFASLAIIDAMIRLMQDKETVESTLYYDVTSAYIGERFYGYIKIELPLKTDFTVTLKNIHYTKKRRSGSSGTISSSYNEEYDWIWYETILGQTKVTDQNTYVSFVFDIPEDAVASGDVANAAVGVGVVSERYYWKIVLKENKRIMPLKREFEIKIKKHMKGKSA